MTWAMTSTQKAGTTSLANCLKLHPAISGMDGLPWHEALSKESHFFHGVFGPNHASSATLYRSFFPTILCRWWAEHVRGVKKVHLLMCSVAERALLPSIQVHMYPCTQFSMPTFKIRQPVKTYYGGVLDRMQLCVHVSYFIVMYAAVAVLRCLSCYSMLAVHSKADGSHQP